MLVLHKGTGCSPIPETLEQTNPNYPLPQVTKGLDFQDLKNDYDDDDELDVKNSDQDVLLNDTLLTFTSSVVYGFCLTEKRWREY